MSQLHKKLISYHSAAPGSREMSHILSSREEQQEVSYPVHQLPDHAVPDLRLRVPGAVLPVGHDGDFVLDADVFGDLGGQVHAVALILVVALVHLPVLLKHHVGALLQRGP